MCDTSYIGPVEVVTANKPRGPPKPHLKTPNSRPRKEGGRLRVLHVAEVKQNNNYNSNSSSIYIYIYICISLILLLCPEISINQSVFMYIFMYIYRNL